MRFAAISALVLCACSSGGPAPVTVQQFKVVPRADGFQVLGPDAGVLLDGVGFETRTTKARYESKYGSYKITDGKDAWVAGTKYEWNGAKATVRDAQGTAVGTIEVSAPADGIAKVVATAAISGTNRIKLSLKCSADDRFLGFGGQSDGLDHRGHLVPIFTSEPGIGKSEADEPEGELWYLQGTRHASSYGLPSFLSNRGFIGVLEHDGRSVFDLCKATTDAYAVEAWSNTWTFWLYFGDTPALALERATAGLLGRPPRPPAVAFAPWNDAIFGSANVRAVAAALRDAGVPSSVLWTEDFRGGADMGGSYRLKEEWTVDRTLYPDVEAVAADLKAQGFSWHAYFNTFLVEDTAVFGEARTLGHHVHAPDGGMAIFTGVTFRDTSLVDLSKPAARDWMKGYLKQAIALGFDGWMADYGEWLPPDAVLSSGEDPIAAHQRYAHEWAKLNYELTSDTSDGRPDKLFFSRSGWLGSTQFIPVVWGGDQRTSFQRDDGLYSVIPIGLNLGLAGVSTYGHDIAGYQSATNPPSTRELFYRWTQLGAFSPVMRTHHGTAARDNWRWDKDAATVAFYRRYATLHIRLFPYFDAAFSASDSKGMPLMRALPLIAPEDPAGWGISDTYGLGPSLLVAPVVEEGKTTRVVHFPPGRWIPLEGGAVRAGPADVEVPAPLEEIPVFAREGTVLPMLPAGVKTLLPTIPADRELWIYRGASGSFTERDGATYTLTFDASVADALPAACTTPAQRGCTDGDVVRLDGAGPFAFPKHRLTVSGGPARTLDVRLIPVP